jgi:hypothetical protein
MVTLTTAINAAQTKESYLVPFPPKVCFIVTCKLVRAYRTDSRFSAGDIASKYVERNPKLIQRLIRIAEGPRLTLALLKTRKRIFTMFLCFRSYRKGNYEQLK